MNWRMQELGRSPDPGLQVLCPLGCPAPLLCPPLVSLILGRPPDPGSVRCLDWVSRGEALPVLGLLFSLVEKMTPLGQPLSRTFLGHIMGLSCPPRSPAPPHQHGLSRLRPPADDASSASVSASPVAAATADAVPAGSPAGPRACRAPKASAPRVPSRHAVRQGAHQAVSLHLQRRPLPPAGGDPALSLVWGRCRGPGLRGGSL